MRTLDIDEAAEFLKIDRTTALKLAGCGALPGAKVGRAWVFLEEDLTEYLRTEVRKQQRERQLRSVTDDELNSAVERAKNEPVLVLSRGRARERRSRPDLSAYPSP